MLHFCDGFDSYTETADLIKHKWHRYLTYHYNTTNENPSDVVGAWEWSMNEGVNGGGCVKHVGAAIGDELGTQFNYSANGYNGRSQYSTLFWFKIATPPVAKQLLCQWYHNSGWFGYSTSLLLYVMPDGTLSFEVKRFVSFVGYFDEPVYTTQFDLCDNEWHCLELRVNFSTTNRMLKIGIDDFVVADLTFTLTMQNTTAKQIAFFSLGVDMWIDDVIIWDEAGDTPVLMPWGAMTDVRADEFIWDWYNEKPINGDLNNFPERGQDDFFYWMGMKQITTLRPASDGVINDFTLVGAATKLDAVDDDMPDATKYLTGNVPGDRMLFNFDDFQYDVPIHSVVVNSLNVMEEHGSIVAHAEALNPPNFTLGVRRRISGRYDVLPNGPPVVFNGGPTFVNTTGWVAYDAVTDISIVDGRLRITHDSTTHTDPDPRIELAIPIIPNKLYWVTIKRPVKGTLEANGDVLLRGSAVAGLSYTIDSINVSSGQTSSELWFIPPYVSTLYLQLWPAAATPGYYDIDFISIKEMVTSFDFRRYQWAFRYNPTTALEWDQAAINASQFGMRVSP